MSFKRLTILLLSVAAAAAVSCSGAGEDAPTRWGKENFYNDFLWKKHVPDTLYREIAFEFNNDAQKYMTEPLRLGLFKKSGEGKMIPVTESEIEVFVSGEKCEGNIISVSPEAERLKVGIVFNPAADNKVHRWFFKPVDDGGLDRINDMDADTFTSPDSSLLGIEAEKNKIMNPLAEGLTFTAVLLIGALLVWLLVLKRIFFPTFRVGKIILNDPVPYMCQKRLRGARKLILTSKKSSQSGLDKFFTGKVIRDVNPMWTSDIVIEPRDRSSVRMRASKEYTAVRIMKTNIEYTVQNNVTGTSTKIKIS